MPKKLSWNPNYSVGEPTLDAQHQKLMGLCNRLSTCLADNDERANAMFFEILADLSAYAREHFETEESILRACKYPRLTTQEADHAEYERHVREFLASARGSVLDKADLLKLMTNWWRDHILIADMDYRNHVVAFNQASHQPAAAPFRHDK
jgi:hemerythrin